MRSRISMITAMIFFGSIGLFVRQIRMTSGQISLIRALIGVLFIAAAMLITRRKLAWRETRRKGLLILSGVAMGFNWILLFEAYRYTTIASATVAYYFCPVFVMLLSPILLKEKLTGQKIFCLLDCLLGLILVTGNQEGGVTLTGVALGLGAAALYASVVLLNKFVFCPDDFTRTVVQMGSAAVVLFPYVLLTDGLSLGAQSGLSVICLLVLGLVHTGVCYLLYFSSLAKLPTQTTAVLSYLDPMFAIFLSWIVLGESMTAVQSAGCLLILMGAMACEFLQKSAKNQVS